MGDGVRIMNEPDYNTYQITVTVRDIRKGDALSLADSYSFLASGTKGKDASRVPEDIQIAVAHVKAVEML
jgi:hypothetical protein